MADSDLDSLYDTSLKARMIRFARRVINTRYLFIALILHVVALAIFGGKVIFEAVAAKGLFESEGEIFVAGPPGGGPPPPPPPPPSGEQSLDIKVQKPTRIVTQISTPKVSTEFNLPPPQLPTIMNPALEVKVDEGARERLAKAEAARWGQMRSFHEAGVEGGGGKRGATGSKRTTQAKFKCYVVQYHGGDWDSNFGVTDGTRWYGNCIYNLMLQIGRWTQGRVKADLIPQALALGDSEWLEKVKPPFVFMTGHKDFRLTDKEVENLRQYLMLGGALWVDNSLPGRRSRFDLALRREMKKVLPDRDFEPIAPSHPLFSSYFQFTAPPPGMNFYDEPVEVVKIGGEVAVVYTLNAYSDLWETGLTDKDAIDLGFDWSVKNNQRYYRSGPHFNRGGYQRGIFFRNNTQEGVVRAYQFGINITIYLLTRFQDKFMTLPRGAG
ncbi:MAG: DUF4159 domain-containing protein [Verrucomicrobiae bacterium]|nr:DUF4159 domain-containing protein [Verrucomicrobiae bacterium]